MNQSEVSRDTGSVLDLEEDPSVYELGPTVSPDKLEEDIEIRSDNEQCSEIQTLNAFHGDEDTARSSFNVIRIDKEFPNYHNYKKSYYSFYSMPTAVMLGNSANMLFSPEFIYSGIKWSCIFFPKGENRQADNTHVDMNVQVKYYQVNPRQSIIFRVSLMGPREEDEPLGDVEQFERETRPFYLRQRDEDDSCSELKVTRFLYRPYMGVMFQRQREMKFRVEMELCTELSGADQVRVFIMWVDKKLSSNEDNFEASMEHLRLTRPEYYLMAHDYARNYKVWQLTFTGFQYLMFAQQFVVDCEAKFEMAKNRSLEQFKFLHEDHF